MSIWFYCNRLLEPLFLQETFAQLYNLAPEQVVMILIDADWGKLEAQHALAVELSIRPNGDFLSLVEIYEQQNLQKTYSTLELCSHLCTLWDCDILIDDTDPLHVYSPYAYVHLTKNHPPRQVVADADLLDAKEWGISIGRFRDE
jgi:hypothetical protein